MVSLKDLRGFTVKTQNLVHTFDQDAFVHRDCSDRIPVVCWH